LESPSQYLFEIRHQPRALFGRELVKILLSPFDGGQCGRRG
jgi:hypothetical protein